MKKFFYMIVSVLIISVLSGCVSSTRVNFSSNVQDAEIYVDGVFVGNTPVTTKMSNAIWSDPDVVAKAPGCADTTVDVKKEFKVANGVIGLFLNMWAWLWCYGPKDNQTVTMSK